MNIQDEYPNQGFLRRKVNREIRQMRLHIVARIVRNAVVYALEDQGLLVLTYGTGQ